MPKPEHILQRAAEHMAARAQTYDKPEGERSMAATVQAFNSITGHNLTEAQGWLFMALLKAVRAFQREGYHADSVEDMAAYVALMGEAKARETTKANEPKYGSKEYPYVYYEDHIDGREIVPEYVVRSGRRRRK